MSERGRPDLSPTQLVAGGLATATATVAASYLGVAGTIIGAAFMSVATTAGAAIYQFYLDRGKRRYATLVATETRLRAVGGSTARAEPAAGGKPAESTRVESTRVESTRVESTRTESTRAEPAGPDPAGPTRPDTPLELTEPAGQKEPAALAQDGGVDGTRTAPRWYVLAGAAFATFAVVIGAITAIESLAHKPVSAMLGKSSGSGTSLGETFGGDGGQAPARQPVVPSSAVPDSPSSTVSGVPSDTASAGPSSGPAEPTTAPVHQPSSSPSAPHTTRPPAPTPTTPTTQPPRTTP